MNLTPMARVRQRSCERLALQPGQRVLDIGCGPATDTVALGRIVGPAGRVHGLDYDAAMVGQAQAHALAEGVSGWVLHHHGNATALPWPEGHFDACRSAGVFQHLIDPELGFDEVLRVTRPGGRLVVVDTDWASLTIDCAEAGIERRLVRFCAESMVENPYSGRRLPGMFRARRLRDVQIEVIAMFVTELALARQIVRLDALEQEAMAAGVIDAEESRRWQASLECSATSAGFFACVNAVMVSGVVAGDSAGSRNSEH